MDNQKQCPQCGNAIPPSLGYKPRVFCSRRCQQHAVYWRNPQKQNDRCKRWRDANPEKYADIRRKSDAEHRERINTYAREWRAKHGHDGKCSICGIEGKLVYDHCHKTGKHRGYICRNCNSGLGMFRDDVEVLRKAVLYLESA